MISVWKMILKCSLFGSIKNSFLKCINWMEQKEHNLVLILSRYTQNTKIVITWGILNSLQNLLAFHIIKIGLNTAVRVWVMSVGHITL